MVGDVAWSGEGRAGVRDIGNMHRRKALKRKRMHSQNELEIV